MQNVFPLLERTEVTLGNRYIILRKHFSLDMQDNILLGHPEKVVRLSE